MVQCSMRPGLTELGRLGAVVHAVAVVPARVALPVLEHEQRVPGTRENKRQ